MSQLYRPSSGVPDREKEVTSKGKKGTSSKSQKLMVDLGLIQASSTPGTYHLLPLAVKSLGKLSRIVDHFMGTIGAQKIQMPTLTSAKLWKATGRIDGGSELMKLTDRHSREFLLSPTHEEAVCDLIRGHPLNFRNLPLRLYQVTGKFRDELRPRFGLMRGREFLMKDLYTFDKDEESSKITYEEVNRVYAEMFDHIGVKWVKAFGATGMIGGSVSHEFHFPSEIGEDEILQCEKCSTYFNAEILKTEEELEELARVGEKTENISSVSSTTSCTNCGSSQFTVTTAIEVGHSFLLGTKYTKPLRATYTSESSKSKLLEMGCYGLGLTRMLAAAIEVLSKEDEIRWPLYLSPYLFAILPPKAGSKEEPLGAPIAEKLSAHLDKIIPGETLIDDRLDLTIGRRLKDVQKLGIPYILVLGKSVIEKNCVEVFEVSTGTQQLFPKSEIFNYLYDLKSQWKIL